MTRTAGLLFALGMTANVVLAAAPAWQPNRNVELIVATSPGSGGDTTARFIQKVLTEKKLVEAPVTVVNKPGGQGTIGLTYLVQHAGNPHYLFINSPSFLANHIMGRTPIHYSETTPLAQLGTEPVVFTVRADSALKTARELADRVKANPDSVSFSIGTTIGSHNHIAVAQLAKAVGTNPKPLKVVAFAGSADGIAALLGAATSPSSLHPPPACGSTWSRENCAHSRYPRTLA
jgi:putative tricarboxylic transport membrane protein